MFWTASPDIWLCGQHTRLSCSSLTRQAEARAVEIRENGWLNNLILTKSTEEMQKSVNFQT